MKQAPCSLRIALIPALFMTVTFAVIAQLPTDPDLVYVRVTAFEREGNRPVIGLLQEEFKVSEDNVQQDILYFAPEKLPIHAGILLDVDGSTKNDLKARVLSSLTKAGARNDELVMLEPGKIPLNDAILQTLNTLAQSGNNGKPALLLFTSKSDPGGYSFSKVRDRLKGQDIQLFVTALQTPPNVSTDSGRQELRELAVLSGGNSFFTSSPFDLESISLKIVAELRNQYLIGYRSTNKATDGKWRKIKITSEHRDNVTRKVAKIDVRAKPGYYAPATAK